MELTSPSTSASLIDRARTFEPEAWRRLTTIYGPLVYRWCRKADLQQADAADVMQEVFQGVSSAIAAFREGETGGFRGWLYGITRHKISDHFRVQRRRAATYDGEPPALAFDAPASDDEFDELTHVVHATLETLAREFTDRNWQAFRRTVLLEEPAAQVAEDLGMTPAAVRQAKFRILHRLRRELEGM